MNPSFLAKSRLLFSSALFLLLAAAVPESFSRAVPDGPGSALSSRSAASAAPGPGSLSPAFPSPAFQGGIRPLSASPRASSRPRMAAPLSPRNARGRVLFKASARNAVAPDTLEVMVLVTEFKEEKPNRETTTGTGRFGTGDDTASVLNPNRGNIRKSEHYVRKHFDFAKNYFEAVSGGRVTIKPVFFPKPENGLFTRTFALPREMADYNPTERQDKEKLSDFSDRRGLALMTLVRDALKTADKEERAEDNPFKQPAPAEGAYRAYLLYHAGHSSLLDGGTLGALGADTPNDIFDFFATAADFKYLRSARDAAAKAETLGVKVSNDRVVKEVMLLSESAYQDGVTWGVNGILVNQLGRQMGLPDMFDLTRGLSQMGAFEVMDFAGYNPLKSRGFLPVLPSAWSRVYMGWDRPVVARRGKDSVSAFRVASAGRGAADAEGEGAGDGGAGTGDSLASVVQIPLNEREYLLVENRQRSMSDTVTLYFNRMDNALEPWNSRDDSLKVPFSAVDTVFFDSLCDKGKCRPKPENRTLRGVITGASSYDLGLPASGLLVWRVNDWFLDLALRNGSVNNYLGDTLGAQFQGISLLEADGIPSIGKDFRNALGQPVSDFGGGADVLPHVTRRFARPVRGDTVWGAPDTVRFISPYGVSGTGSWNDGRTFIRLEALPGTAAREKGLASFTGDSVFNYRDSVMTLRIHWTAGQAVSRKAGTAWPKRVEPGSRPFSLSLFPAGGAAPLVIALSDKGLVQVFTDSGTALTGTGLDLKVAGLPGYPKVNTLLPSGFTRDRDSVLVSALGPRLGAPLGSAVLPASAEAPAVYAVLTREALHLFRLRADSAATQPPASFTLLTAPGAFPAFYRRSIPVTGEAGPLAANGLLYLLDGRSLAGKNRLLSFDAEGRAAVAALLPEADYASLAALDLGNFDAGGSAAGGAGSGGATGGTAAGGQNGSSGPLALGAAAALGTGAVYQPLALEVGPARAGVVDPAGGLPESGGGAGALIPLNAAYAPPPSPGEVFTFSSADFNRDGVDDALLLGSRGTALLFDVKAGKPFANFPRLFPRRTTITEDTVPEGQENAKPVSITYETEDASPPALADLDGDRHPDFLFSGVNGVYAVDHRGAFVKGWPFFPERRQSTGFTYGNRRFPVTVLRTTPLVLSLDGRKAVFIATPDGLLHAVDSTGKRLKTSSFRRELERQAGLPAVDTLDFPLSLGGLLTESTLESDSSFTPFTQIALFEGTGTGSAGSGVGGSGTGGAGGVNGDLRLFSQTGTGSLDLWSLSRGSVPAGSAWRMPGGDLARQNRLEARSLAAPSPLAEAARIDRFFVYPSPLRLPRDEAKIFLALSRPAQKARLRVYDISGAVVKDETWQDLTAGRQPERAVNLAHLGVDIYSALLEVWFDGKRKEKWVRFGVIR